MKIKTCTMTKIFFFLGGGLETSLWTHSEKNVIITEAGGKKKGMIEILLLLIERVHDDAIPFSYMYHWKSEIPKDNASKDIEF